MNRRALATLDNPIVPSEKVETLGKAPQGHYVRIKGREFLLEPMLLDYPEQFTEHDGQVFVAIREGLTDEKGQTHVIRSRLRRALPVREGTWAAIVAKRDARRLASQPRGPVDALDALHALAAKAPTFGRLDGRQPIRGRDILKVFERAEMTLKVHDGRLLVIAPKGRMVPNLRAVIESPAERLLVGWVSKRPVGCELPHDKKDQPEAWTILLGGLAACQAHAEERS